MKVNGLGDLPEDLQDIIEKSVKRAMITESLVQATEKYGQPVPLKYVALGFLLINGGGKDEEFDDWLQSMVNGGMFVQCEGTITLGDKGKEMAAAIKDGTLCREIEGFGTDGRHFVMKFLTPEQAKDLGIDTMTEQIIRDKFGGNREVRMIEGSIGDKNEQVLH